MRRMNLVPVVLPMLVAVLNAKDTRAAALPVLQPVRVINASSHASAPLQNVHIDETARQLKRWRAKEASGSEQELLQSDGLRDPVNCACAELGLYPGDQVTRARVNEVVDYDTFTTPPSLHDVGVVICSAVVSVNGRAQELVLVQWNHFFGLGVSIPAQWGEICACGKLDYCSGCTDNSWWVPCGDLELLDVTLTCNPSDTTRFADFDRDRNALNFVPGGTGRYDSVWPIEIAAKTDYTIHTCLPEDRHRQWDPARLALYADAGLANLIAESRESSEPGCEGQAILTGTFEPGNYWIQVELVRDLIMAREGSVTVTMECNTAGSALVGNLIVGGLTGAVAVLLIELI